MRIQEGVLGISDIPASDLRAVDVCIGFVKLEVVDSTSSGFLLQIRVSNLREDILGLLRIGFSRLESAFQISPWSTFVLFLSNLRLSTAMLASPGHSPRHVLPLLSPSPSVRIVDSDVSFGHRSLALASTSGNYAARPPLPKKRKTGPIAIDEDTYVAAVEKIIERDFFPDIPKLHNRLEWLEAVRTGDPAVIRDAQIKIIRRRQQQKEREKGSDGLGRLGSEFLTPSSIVSPSISSIRSSPAPSQIFTDVGTHTVVEASSTSGTSSIDTSVSLDKFLSRYTSEDNASFSTLLEKANKQKREKYSFLSEKELISSSLGIANEAIRSTDGFGTSGQPIATLESWPYKAKNLLMYSSADRDDAPSTQREHEEKVEGLPKEIVKKNTRFHGKMFDSKVREEDTVAILYTPVPGSTPASWPFAERDAARARKRYDLEDLRKSPQVFAEEDVEALKNSSKVVSGYSFVATPSLTPGVEESPFMTWGDIEGTPLRLETEDTPVGIGGSGDGPQFKIPAPPSRDARAHRLSRDAARNIREKSILHQGHLTPSSTRGGSASPGMKSFSAAAQKFVSKAMAKTCSTVDARLRASYRASPSPGPSRVGRNATRSRAGSVTSRESSLALRSPSISRETTIPMQSSPPSSVRV